MPSIEEEMLQVANAAREAGARRKQLARSIASTASSSGSSGSGKRSSRTMEPTASTQVTPDPKQVCGGDNAAVVNAPVEPRALAFDPASGEGDTGVDMTQKVYLNPEIWTDAQPRDSIDVDLEDTAIDDDVEISVPPVPTPPVPLTSPEAPARYSEDMVDKLCREKELNGETKPHPEFPGLEEMKLFYCWYEDSTSTVDKYEQRQNLVHETGYGEEDGEGGDGGAAPSTIFNGKGGGKAGKSGGKGNKGSKGGKGGKGGVPTAVPKVSKEKKVKTPNQLARAAIATANNNILEIGQLNLKLPKGGVPDIIRNALKEQLAVSETELRAGKTSLETALAMDQDLVQPTNTLEDFNKSFKETIRQASLHLPKPKAKAKATAKAAA